MTTTVSHGLPEGLSEGELLSLFAATYDEYLEGCRGDFASPHHDRSKIVPFISRQPPLPDIDRLADQVESDFYRRHPELVRS